MQKTFLACGSYKNRPGARFGVGAIFLPESHILPTSDLKQKVHHIVEFITFIDVTKMISIAKMTNLSNLPRTEVLAQTQNFQC